MKAHKNKYLRPAALLAAVVALTAKAAAIYNQLTVAIIIICIYIVIIFDIAIRVNGVEYSGESSGSGNYEVTSVSADDDPNHRATLKPVSVQASSDFGEWGRVETSLDASRDAGESFIEGLVPGQDFPARVRIRFYANATKDGIVYSSVTPVVFASDNVNSFNGFQNEKFQLEAPVDFTGPDGAVAFTLTRLNSTFTN